MYYTYHEVISAPPARRQAMLDSNEYQMEKALREINQGVKTLHAFLDGCKPRARARAAALARQDAAFLRLCRTLTKALS
jgi:hypothetical protein